MAVGQFIIYSVGINNFLKPQELENYKKLSKTKGNLYRLYKEYDLMNQEKKDELLKEIQDERQLRLKRSKRKKVKNVRCEEIIEVNGVGEELFQKVLVNAMINTTREIQKDDKTNFVKSTSVKNEKDIERQLADRAIKFRNQISLFENSLSRALGIEAGTISDELFVVEYTVSMFDRVFKDLVKKGFKYNGNHYIYFSSSSGQTRNKKLTFVKESSWKKIKDKILCGIDEKKIKINTNKYLAYKALSTTSTEVWEEFDINKVIVIPDIKQTITKEVDYINDVTFEITRMMKDVELPTVDGVGMILPSLSEKNFVTRLPWIKGLLASFDFRSAVSEFKGNTKIKDVYGDEWDILEDDIQIILTKSQFKLWDEYKDWEDYKAKFKEFGCEAGKTNVEPDRFRNNTLSYQAIQSFINFTDSDLKKLTEKTNAKIRKISSDTSTQLQVLGAIKAKKDTMQPYQKALLLYPQLMQDTFFKSILTDTKASLLRQARFGILTSAVKMTFVIPDLLDVCCKIFECKEKPPILNDGEVSCKLFKEGIEVDTYRYPMLCPEHVISKNRHIKWFDTNAIYISNYSAIPIISMCDFDGDRLCVTDDETILKLVKKNTQDFVPLYYDMKKAEGTKLTGAKMAKSLKKAYSSCIVGKVSDKITSIYAGSQNMDAIKILTMYNNFGIDSAKTGYLPKLKGDQVCKEAQEALKNNYIFEKKPYFFKYKDNKNYCSIRTNSKGEEIQSKKKKVVMPKGTGIIDRLEDFIEVNKLSIKIQKDKKFDWQKLRSRRGIEHDEEVYKNVTEKFEYIKNNLHTFKNKDNFMEEEGSVSYSFQKKVKEELLKLCNDEKEIVDILVKYYYSGEGKKVSKRQLWNIYGEEIYENIRNNMKTGTKPVNQDSKICVNCENDFVPKSNRQKFCPDCAREAERQRKRKNASKRRNEKVDV